MNKTEVQDYIYEVIPLTKLMEIKVEEFEYEKVVLSTNLRINKNHKGTAFGGSLVTVLTTNCWLMAFKHFKDLDKEAHIVIGKSEIKYLKPVTKDFKTSCEIKDAESVKRAKDYFISKGRSKIDLEAFVTEEDKICVEFKGTFYIYKEIMS